MILYLILSMISNIIIYYMAINAPIGYQDQDGFHYDRDNNQ
jgi:hypothetical protein